MSEASQQVKMTLKVQGGVDDEEFQENFSINVAQAYLKAKYSEARKRRALSSVVSHVRMN